MAQSLPSLGWVVAVSTPAKGLGLPATAGEDAQRGACVEWWNSEFRCMRACEGPWRR